MTGQALSKYASVILTVLDHRLEHDLPCTIKQLVKACQMSDKSITRYTNELIEADYLRVSRQAGYANDYEVLRPPSKTDLMTTLIHLGLPITLDKLPITDRGASL